jgi:hypothetical protein
VARRIRLGRDALKLTVLTAVRMNENRFATWGEFDLAVAKWSMPAERMKIRKRTSYLSPLPPSRY